MIVSCAQCGTKNRVDANANRSRQPVCGKCGAALDTSQPVAETKPVVVTDASFATEVIAASNRAAVLVDCWADGAAHAA